MNVTLFKDELFFPSHHTPQGETNLIKYYGRFGVMEIIPLAYSDSPTKHASPNGPSGLTDRIGESGLIDQTGPNGLVDHWNNAIDNTSDDSRVGESGPYDILSWWNEFAGANPIGHNQERINGGLSRPRLVISDAGSSDRCPVIDGQLHNNSSEAEAEHVDNPYTPQVHDHD